MFACFLCLIWLLTISKIKTYVFIRLFYKCKKPVNKNEKFIKKGLKLLVDLSKGK
jgi:hypothetical protein